MQLIEFEGKTALMHDKLNGDFYLIKRNMVGGENYLDLVKLNEEDLENSLINFKGRTSKTMATTNTTLMK